MKTIDRAVLEELSESYHLLSKAFKWRMDFYKHMIAVAYLHNHKPVNVYKIQSMMDYMELNAGPHSTFNEGVQFLLSGILCAYEDDPEKTFDTMQEYGSHLHAIGFRKPIFVPVSTYVMSRVCDVESYESHIHSSNKIFEQLSRRHPFLTKADDFPLALLMDSSQTDVATVDAYYQALLKRGFIKSEGLMPLAFVLSLSGKDKDQVAKDCRRIFQELGGIRLKLRLEYDVVLGLLNLIEKDADELIEEVHDLVRNMRHVRGFKWLGKDLWVTMAVLIIYSNYLDSKEGVDHLLELARLTTVTSVISAVAIQVS